MNNEQIDEYSIEHKISLLQRWLPSLSGKRFSGVLYDDEIDALFSMNKYYYIISMLECRISKDKYPLYERYKDNDEATKSNAEEILYFKNAIDDYIEEKSDFYKLDFIMDHLIEQTSHYQRFLSPLYIIEMLIVKPKEPIREQMKEKIKYFYNGDNKDIKNNLEGFANGVYEIRSKLVHGYFKNFEKELQKYKRNFMKDYDLDYCEFTENHWIIGSAAIVLEGIAKNLVMALLQAKEDMFKFKNDDKTSIYFKVE